MLCCWWSEGGTPVKMGCRHGWEGRWPRSHTWILLPSRILIKIHLIFISSGFDILLPSCKNRQQFLPKWRYLRSTCCHPESSNKARNHAVLTHQERMAEGEYISPTTVFLLHSSYKYQAPTYNGGQNAIEIKRERKALPALFLKSFLQWKKPKPIQTSTLPQKKVF